MQDSVAQYALTCPQCQLSQRRVDRKQEPYTQVKIDARPFEKWAIDFVGPLPESHDKKKWILTAIDIATGWPLARATTDAKAEVVADFLSDIYVNYGAFRELLSDNGTNLSAEIVEEYLKRIRGKHQLTTAYHPQTNGKVERFNGMLGSILTKFLVNKNIVQWTDFLPSALFACRIRNHSSTGMSPFKLLYGMEPRLTGDQIDFDRDRLDDDLTTRLERMLSSRALANRKLVEKGIKARKLRADRLQKFDVELEPGQYVLLVNEHREKFQPTYFGPFRVEKRLFFGTYVLSAHMVGETQPRILEKPVNGTRLRLYYPSDDDRVRVIMSQAWKELLDARGGRIEAPTKENMEFIDRHSDPPNLSRSAFLTRLGPSNVSGDRSFQVGEGPDFRDTTADATRFIQSGRRGVVAWQRHGEAIQQSAKQFPTLSEGATVTSGQGQDPGVAAEPSELTETVEKPRHVPEMPGLYPQITLEGVRTEQESNAIEREDIRSNDEVEDPFIGLAPRDVNDSPESYEETASLGPGEPFPTVEPTPSIDMTDALDNELTYSLSYEPQSSVPQERTMESPSPEPSVHGSDGEDMVLDKTVRDRKRPRDPSPVPHTSIRKRAKRKRETDAAKLERVLTTTRARDVPGRSLRSTIKLSEKLRGKQSK